MIETITIKISDEIQSWIRKQKNFLGHIAKITSAISLALLCAFPKIAWLILYSIISWQNFLIGYIILFTFDFYILFPKLLSELKEMKKVPWELLFMGISLNQLTDYLMKTGTFKREDIEREFGIARMSYYDMVKVMDEVGIFIRGENNQRRVDIRLSKDDILSLLSPEQDMSEISEEIEEADEQAVQTVDNQFAIRKISED